VPFTVVDSPFTRPYNPLFRSKTSVLCGRKGFCKGWRTSFEGCEVEKCLGGGLSCNVKRFSEGFGNLAGLSGRRGLPVYA
jgi:hypothetical protein